MDIAIINAGIPAEALMDTSEADIDHQIAVDFASYLTSAQAAASRTKGGSDIVLIGSMAADARTGGDFIYVAAKSGIEGFARSLRQELADCGIKVGVDRTGLYRRGFFRCGCTCPSVR